MKKLKQFWGWTALFRPNQFMLIMKLTLFFTCVLTLSSFAALHSQTISFSGKNVRLSDFFKVIKKQVDYDVISKTVDIQHIRLDIDLKAEKLEQALDKTLGRYNLHYTIQHKAIIIRKATAPTLGPASRDSGSSQQEQLHVKGAVVSSSGTPLAGVSVKVKGKKITTVTNDQGMFILTVTPGDVLSFSSLGFLSVEIKAYDKNRAEIVSTQTQYKNNIVQQGALISYAENAFLVTLVPSVKELDEVNVVNTGYQRISLDRSAGAFAKPDMKIIADRTNSGNILNRLEGLVPGLSYNNDTKAPLIRGLSTIEGNQNPLVVVDGIPTEHIASINPDDVADITVLKDAVAASVWGARASNGVIVVTTKKGSRQEKIKINYSGYINLQGKPYLDWVPMMNSQQYIQYSRETFNPIDWPYEEISTYGSYRQGISPDRQILYDMHRGTLSQERGNAMLDSLSRIDNTQSIKDMYDNAYQQNHTLSLSGGGNRHTFYGSMAFSESKSATPGTRAQTYKVNLSQDFQFNKAIKVNLITDLSYSNPRSDRSYTPTRKNLPYQLFRDADGQPLDINYLGYLSERSRMEAERATGVDLRYNPIENAKTGFTKGKGLSARIIGRLQVDLYKGLRYEGSFGYMHSNNRTEIYDDAQTNYEQRFKVAAFYDTQAKVYRLPKEGGRFELDYNNVTDWTVRNQLAYDKSWQTDKHQLTLLFGHELQANTSINDGTLLYGYDTHLQTHTRLDWAKLNTEGAKNSFIPHDGFTSKLTELPFEQRERETRFRSFYATAGYTFKQRYTLNGSWRNDQSNLFGTSSRAKRKPTWSVGGKWLISAEEFMQPVTIVDRLALRATYGITGNSPLPGSAASVDILRGGASPYLPGSGRYLNIATPGNPELTWEATRTLNIGTEISLYNSYITLSIDYYRRNTKGLLGNVVVNPATGHRTLFGNVGDMRNRGIEFNLQTRNISTADFEWQSTLNLAYNSNRIGQINPYYPTVTARDQLGQLFYAGMPAYSDFGYRYAGLDNQGRPTAYMANGDKNWDYEAFMKDDVYYMGVLQQPWAGGLMNSLRYKNFNLDAQLILNLGHVIHGPNSELYRSEMDNSPSQYRRNTLALLADRWKQPGDENRTDIPRYLGKDIADYYDVGLYSSSDRVHIKASYMKFRDINLSYTVPQQFLSRYGIERLQLRASIANLMLWKANKIGVDPERLRKTYSIGLRLNF